MVCIYPHFKAAYVFTILLIYIEETRRVASVWRTHRAKPTEQNGDSKVESPKVTNSGKEDHDDDNVC